jgi:hypothetical protein
MRIIELTREAVEPAKPLQILPQGVQTPPPATGPGSAEYKQAMKYVNDLDKLGAVGNSPASPAPAKPAPANAAKPAMTPGTPGFDFRAASAAANAAKPPPLTDKDVAPKRSSLTGKNPQLQMPPEPAPAVAKPAPAASTPNLRPTAAAGYQPQAAATLGNPAAFGGGVVNPPSKSGVVSKADLDAYRRDSGNPTATLGQYMNQQQGLTARKGGANDPAVIAARQQPAGPPVGSQTQTAGGANELNKQGLAANAPALAQPAAAPTVVSRNDGVPPPVPAVTAPAQPAPAAEPAPAASTATNPLRGNFPATNASTLQQAKANADSQAGTTAGPLRGNFPGRQTTNPNAADYDADLAGVEADVADMSGQPVASGTPGQNWNVTTRSAKQIGDTNPRTGVVTPGSYDANRANGEKNLQTVKDFGNKISSFLGGNKQPATAPAAAPANPLRGVKESVGTQDPVLVRMQNLAGIRR